MTATAMIILAETSSAYGVSPEAMRSKIRLREVVNARSAACYLLTRYLNMSYRETGTLFSITYGAVMHGVRKVESWRQFPKMYKTELEPIRKIEDKYFKKP